MSRKIARELAVLSVYEYGFRANSAEDILEHLFSEDFLNHAPEELSLSSELHSQQGYISQTVLGTVEHAAELDEYIQRHAIGWSLDRISRIAAAILRTAIYEAKYADDIPVRVAVNEAVEIAKKYDTPETVSFINGVLGSVMKEVGIE